MTETKSVDVASLREDVKMKYREVALNPHRRFHFHTGRPLAARLEYDPRIVDGLPDAAVESFAGVGNPFSLGNLNDGEKVVDAGSGAGFDSFVAAAQVGPGGQVIGVDMTDEMLEKSRATATMMNLQNIEFRKGLLEDMPIEDAWADVVLCNGAINLCADKPAVFKEILRVLKPGGRVQFADIANGAEVPESAAANVELWTS